MQRTYVITGAGTGIGRATAVILSELADVQLVLVARNEKNLAETKSQCKNPEHVITASFDIRDKNGWRSLSKQLPNQTEIHGLFANAGVGGENHYGEDDRWDEIISTNLTGTYITIMEMLPWLKKSSAKFKHIVITSSCLARFGVVNYPAYCTAKTGLLGLTKSFALQFASDNILVNAICPGWVNTDMALAGIQNLAERNHKPFEEEFTTQMSYVPLNRISSPDEIGRFVKFLFSSEQTSMTGQGIDINNGSFMI
jgi:NAD(P)-dependent dehydrogenase (short-subunit alcohol dehydrogenase family)